MNLIGKVLDKISTAVDLYCYSIRREKYNLDLSFLQAIEKFQDRNTLHAYMHHHFLYFAQRKLVDHRNYFKKEMRGFGEDAFHSMWLKLFMEYRPKNVLEIGVYRGQVITLWGILNKFNDVDCEIHGLSPFSAAGDGVSDYLKNLDYMNDILHSAKYFDIQNFRLKKCFSTDEEGKDYIKSKKWDLIYIDGNHDYEAALSDYRVCKDSLASGGILVMDDSSLYTDYKPPKFSFAGHPGPSKVVTELAMGEMKFLAGVGHNNIFQKY